MLISLCLKKFPDRSNKLLAYYHNIDSINATLIHSNNSKERFVNLQMKLGIGVAKNKMSTFVSFFQFSNSEMSELNALMAGFSDEDQMKKNTNMYAVS